MCYYNAFFDKKLPTIHIVCDVQRNADLAVDMTLSHVNAALKQVECNNRASLNDCAALIVKNNTFIMKNQRFREL